jgi:hypothetical protein
MDFGRTVSTKAPTARDRRRKELIKKILIIAGLIVVSFGIFCYLMNLKSFRIEKVVIFGTDIVSENDVMEAVDKEISGKYFFVIPKNNLFFYPKEKIKSALMSRFGRIGAVYPAIDRGSILVVSVSERSGEYLWCGEKETADGSARASCYFMDKTGYIFVKSPYFSENVFFTVYGQLASTSNPIGARVVPATEFTRIVEFKDLIEEIGFDAKAVGVLKDGDYELVLKGAGKILFNTKNDLIKSVNNIRLAVTSAPLSGELKAKSGLLQYIDVRFGNKVFYKFND